MIVLVCGGRDFEDWSYLHKVLTEHLPHNTRAILHGDAAGADRMAGTFAKMRGIPVITIPANFEFYGKGGGPIRNGWMLEFLDVGMVIAFPGGSGTANMMKQARAEGIHVLEVVSREM